MSSSSSAFTGSFRKSLLHSGNSVRHHRRHRMAVSVRSTTWAILLLQLVLSCTAIVASVAVVSAQSQSVSAQGVPLGPTPSMLFVCALSFALLGASILGMFGLQGRRPLLLLPVISVSAIVCTFHSIALGQWLSEWWRSPRAERPVDPDWLITFTGSVAFQLAFMLAIFLQIRCYRLLN